MGTWNNNDGLYIRFGVDEGATGRSGEYGTPEFGTRVEEAIINLTSLNTSTYTVIDDFVRIPKDHRIEKVELYTDVAATSTGAATFTLGTIKPDRSTEDDYDGLVLATATPLANINAKGEVVRLDVGSTGAGALIGGETATAGALLVARAGTEVYTAGKIRVRIYMRAVNLTSASA